MSEFIFAIFPYIAIVLAVVVSIMRYRTNSYNFSSLSSQFLEGRELFWGSVPWHYGILVVMLGHLVAFITPAGIIAFGSTPLRLLILEVTALIFGLMALVGLILLIKRRLTSERVLAVTSTSDIILLLLLLVQVGSGVSIAMFYKWGSSWYASALVPYLRSIFTFAPDISYVTSMPFAVQLHIFNAFLLLAFIPFTRLLHFLVLPISYLWRSYQVVRWNWDPKTRRK